MSLEIKYIGYAILMDGKPLKTGTSFSGKTSKLYSSEGYAKSALKSSVFKKEYETNPERFEIFAVYYNPIV